MPPGRCRPVGCSGIGAEHCIGADHGIVADNAAAACHTVGADQEVDACIGIDAEQCIGAGRGTSAMAPAQVTGLATTVAPAPAMGWVATLALARHRAGASHGASHWIGACQVGRMCDRRMSGILLFAPLMPRGPRYDPVAFDACTLFEQT